MNTQSENDIFALDIGTRNVVAMLCRNEGDCFEVLEYVSVPHSTRSMADGQIEDIGLAAQTVSKAVAKLSEKTGIAFERVCLAAAGRSLVTHSDRAEQSVDPEKSITAADVKSLELQAVSQAQDSLLGENSAVRYYCVGHSVTSYTLDGYPISNLEGHRGENIGVQVISAFLPSTVVESLYEVAKRCGLTVSSLTLEPMAAMSVIIPPELRLINAALADIGAGTADIAAAKDGSIIGYRMATVAGDEITEEIARRFIVDFDTAERIKTSSDEKIEFTDILGFEHTIDHSEVEAAVKDTVEELARAVSEGILSANGGTAPAAVFLVGGSGHLKGLCGAVAQHLGMSENRVAVGGVNIKRKIAMGDRGVISGIDPLLVTPVGIGITSAEHTGYDFTTVTLNSRKVRMLDTRDVKCGQLLLSAGCRTNDIIARTGRGLVFTVNGERRSIRGEAGIPAVITINGEPASLEHPVHAGDEILFTPAVAGKNASVTIADIAGDTDVFPVYVDGAKYFFGITAVVNGRAAQPDRAVQSGDEIEISVTSTLAELLDILPPEYRGRTFTKGGRHIEPGYLLGSGDRLVSHAPQTSMAPAAEEAHEPEALPPEKDTSAAGEKPFTVILNGVPTVLEGNKDGSGHIFLELMAIADIDTSSPPPGGNMLLKINGRDAAFMDPLNDGDEVVIRWDE
ncbi:MAG: pilus assembly protein PilM [Oscillospiraceae bacterium]|nr:pilus assembly protein PilM [Oscillospiraceae bacterium]